MTPIQQDEEPIKCYCRNAVQAHFCEEKCDVYMKAQQGRELKKAEPSPLTPIQQAIEQVKVRIENNNKTKEAYPESSERSKAYTLINRTLNIQLSYLQSLLPVEKKWAENMYDDGADGALSFETIYSQFNEVK